MATSLKALIAKQAEVKKEIKENGKEALKEAFAAFFDKNPQCKALRWRQYTPYFNDGDSCTFSVRDAEVSMDFTAEDAGDYEDGFDSYSNYYDERGKYADISRESIEAWKKATRDADELVGCDEELFEMVFGDHVEVTATREGFDIDSYDHD